MLSQSARVFLIVRGPAPSCRVAGVVPVRGRKGANTIDFAGRIRGRALGPGVYLITVSLTRRLAPDAPAEYVRVVSPRRSVPLADAARKPSCSEAQALAATPAALTTQPAQPAQILLNEKQTARPVVSLEAPVTGSGSSDDDSGVLPGIFPNPDEIGAAAGGSDIEALATFAVLGFLGALLLGMLALVTRFLRGSWNP